MFLLDFFPGMTITSLLNPKEKGNINHIAASLSLPPAQAGKPVPPIS
jgi:hypothetical protein